MAIVKATALPGKMQMIDEEGKFSSDAKSFADDLKQHSSARSSYMVMSIIGPQSGGKSTLLNTVFGTEFEMLDGKKGRKQTTKGIWIARCINPCMILMDVEGSDGQEREDNVLFERQAALFALTVSDVLLLNMWYKDIGRNQGASTGLLKLIFQERVLITGVEKTRVVICIRDHDYEECSPDITRDNMEATMMKLWNEVHPAKSNKIMSDYIDVVVIDFPHKNLQKKEFAEKCNYLAELLASAAASNQAEGQYYAAGFVFSSEKIWNLIRDNKRLNAADHKVAMASYICGEIMKQITSSMVHEKEYESLMGVEANNLKEFNKLLSPFVESLLLKYDTETELLDKSVRDNKKEILEANIFEKLKQTYVMRIQTLWHEIVSLALSEVTENMEKLKNPSDLTVVDSYIRKFNESCGEVHRLFQGLYNKKLEDLKSELRIKLQETATAIEKQLYEKEMQAQHKMELLELERIHDVEKERLKTGYAEQRLCEMKEEITELREKEKEVTNPLAEVLAATLGAPVLFAKLFLQGGASTSRK